MASTTSCSPSDMGLGDRLAKLLTEGCDDRIIVDAVTGMHKYNGTNKPVAGSVRRSSCTFNVPTEDAFEAGMEALRSIEQDPSCVPEMQSNVVSTLKDIWGTSDAAVTLFPSGTDAEFMPTLVGLARALKKGGRLVSMVTCAGEVGSGTLQASSCKHFAPLLPRADVWGKSHTSGATIFEEADDPKIDAVALKLRDSKGQRLCMAQLDAMVQESVEKALGADGYSVALVHMVVGCKTGQLMPSMDCMRELMAIYGDRILPVADACQVRMVDGALKSLVDAGFAVLATGSKFYGGPPFCGVALLPEAMAEELNEAMAPGAEGNLRDRVARSALKAYITKDVVAEELPALGEVLPEVEPNLGLLLRWQMSLRHIERYHSVPEAARHSLEVQWMAQAAEQIKERDLPTVAVYSDKSAKAPADLSVSRQRSTAAKAQSGMLPDATILCLDLRRPDGAGGFKRVSLEEAKKIHTLMAKDLSAVDGIPDKSNSAWSRRCFLAQPVQLAPEVVVLRSAVGAPLVLRLHHENAWDAVREEDGFWIEKLNLLLSHWDFAANAPAAVACKESVQRPCGVESKVPLEPLPSTGLAVSA